MDTTIILIISTICGYILDQLFGDPVWLPHPVVAFGNAIHTLEKKWNSGKRKYTKGAIIALLLVIATYLAFYFLFRYAEIISHWIFGLITAVFLFFGLANKTLIKEGTKVFAVLDRQGLEAGRKQLSRIVGRDTAQLSDNQIKTAVLETMSENLSDGVVAPLFYFAIGGIPAMMAYKMINTLDSMIGYKSERYKKFGYFAAKLDDVANFIPARLTAFLMATLTLSHKSFKFIKMYGNAHSSPNAGYPEAALAGILNCQFGGTNVYHGKTVTKPYIGNNQRTINKYDLKKTVLINQLVCFTMIILICIKEIIT